MNEIFPVGVPLRWGTPGTEEPALALQVGSRRVTIDDDVAGVTWRLLGGEPTFRPDGGFGRDNLVELMRVRFDGDGGEAERRAVYNAVELLVAKEAAAEIDTSDSDQLLQAAAALRLRGLGGVVGADRDSRFPHTFHLGIDGVIDLPTGRRELELFIRSDSGASLWELAQQMSADPRCHGTRDDIDWNSAEAQLPFVFFEVRRMLWHGLALLDLID